MKPGVKRFSLFVNFVRSQLFKSIEKGIRLGYRLDQITGYNIRVGLLSLFSPGMTMTKRLLGFVGCALLWAPAVLALDSPAQPGLKLEPPPKEVQLRDGGFRVCSRTKIFVLVGHQSEDRIAAETLAEEVEDQSGLRLDIVGMKAKAKAEGKSIVLARLSDPRVRRFLARNGLKADQAMGTEGYLLFSDKTHLIVAANTGEGLFYGVQTLRQLLRPAAKGLICPAVGIRDWPTITLPNNVSDSPALVQNEMRPRA